MTNDIIKKIINEDRPIELHEDLEYCYEDGNIDFCTYFKTLDGSDLIEIWID